MCIKLVTWKKVYTLKSGLPLGIFWRRLEPCRNLSTLQFWLQSTTMIRFTRRRTRDSCTTYLYAATYVWVRRREKGIFCPMHFCRNLYVSRYRDIGDCERAVYTFRRFGPHRQIQNDPCNLVSGGGCCRQGYNTVLVDSRSVTLEFRRKCLFSLK